VENTYMDDMLLAKFGEVGITPDSTSYFSTPSSDLDPNIFMGNRIKPWVRNNISRILFDYLAVRYNAPAKWITMWLAGSGVSYQWSAARDPGDLDCLVGIDYYNFRKLNSEYAGLSNVEIAAMFNEDFNADLLPTTKDWHGYELTYYVNPQSDIRDINPYAAYNLTEDNWTVEPSPYTHAPYSKAWEQQAQRDYDFAMDLLAKYSSALSEIKSATNEAYRTNAERRLNLAVDQAVAFYDMIHSGRKEAFSNKGSGYSDFHNYRWQAGKKSGVVQALRAIKNYKDTTEKENQLETYGVELPNARTLIRRAIRK
jgi:hypothetical protein